MITTRDLLDIAFTSRALLRRALDQLLRRLLLRPPLRPIGPVVELRASLAFVPSPVMHDAEGAVASYALELRRLAA
jgi:hypothetical protein